MGVTETVKVVQTVLNPSDLSWDYTKGKGPGGQNKNKVETCVILKHVPTGIVVRIDGRSRVQNQKRAIREMEARLRTRRANASAKVRKDRREAAIRHMRIIRTYDGKAGVVRDHRTGKTASLKDVLGKGRIDLLRESADTTKPAKITIEG